MDTDSNEYKDERSNQQIKDEIAELDELLREAGHEKPRKENNRSLSVQKSLVAIKQINPLLKTVVKYCEILSSENPVKFPQKPIKSYRALADLLDTSDGDTCQLVGISLSVLLLELENISGDLEILDSYTLRDRTNRIKRWVVELSDSMRASVYDQYIINEEHRKASNRKSNQKRTNREDE